VETRETAAGPSAQKKKSSALTASSGKVLTKKDGIFRLIGIGKTKVTGGFSWRKHELGI
jgi:hypothetical protein